MTKNTFMQPSRSFIFVPGLRPDMFSKAVASGVDMVGVELEDGIAPKDKAVARQKALSLFDKPHSDDGIERIGSLHALLSLWRPTDK
jgi:(S)-citramalyl-CoA lyase